MVPYNLEAVLGRIFCSNPVQEEIFFLDKIPTTTAQLRSLAHHGRQLVALSSDSTELGKVINLLEHMALVVQSVNAAVKEHEATQVKKELNKKKGWKSQVRLRASPNKTGRAWTREEIDCAMARYHAKEEIVVKRLQAKEKRQAGKEATQLGAQPFTLSDEQVHTSDEGIIDFFQHIYKYLLIYTLESDVPVEVQILDTHPPHTPPKLGHKAIKMLLKAFLSTPQRSSVALRVLFRMNIRRTTRNER